MLHIMQYAGNRENFFGAASSDLGILGEMLMHLAVPTSIQEAGQRKMQGGNRWSIQGQGNTGCMVEARGSISESYHLGSSERKNLCLSFQPVSRCSIRQRCLGATYSCPHSI